jgi:hypothetical protein
MLVPCHGDQQSDRPRRLVSIHTIDLGPPAVASIGHIPPSPGVIAIDLSDQIRCQTPRAERRSANREEGGRPMRVMMVLAKVKADSIDEIEAQGRKLFSEIEQAQPQGLRYATCRLPDGTYLNLLGIEDGVDNPLLALPAARAFQEKLKGWLAEPASSQALTVIGSYRLF